MDKVLEQPGDPTKTKGIFFVMHTNITKIFSLSAEFLAIPKGSFNLDIRSSYSFSKIY